MFVCVMCTSFLFLDFVSDVVYVDLKYDYVFVILFVNDVLFGDGLLCWRCLVLLLRVEWVCEWCISSRVCIVFVLYVCFSGPLLLSTHSHGLC